MDAVERGDEIDAQEMVDEAANEAGYVYKRNSRSKVPAKGSPLLQFVEEDSNFNLRHYGQYQFAAHGRGAIDINDIFSDIKAIADEFYDTDVSDAEIDPPDIVSTAGVWDDLEFVGYVWDNYFDAEYGVDNAPIPAIKTYDGLLVWGGDYARIKSADAITYDDNGDVIPLSERFKDDNPDIRYSLESKQLTELRRENRELKARVEFWRGQTQRTTAKSVRNGDIKTHPPPQKLHDAKHRFTRKAHLTCRKAHLTKKSSCQKTRAFFPCERAVKRCVNGVKKSD